MTPVLLARSEMVLAPATVEPPTATVTTLLVVLPLSVAGVNVTVAPAGRPSAARVTTPAKPANRAMVSVVVTAPPTVTAPAERLADSVIEVGTSGGSVTTVSASLTHAAKNEIASRGARKRRITILTGVRRGIQSGSREYDAGAVNARGARRMVRCQVPTAR